VAGQPLRKRIKNDSIYLLALFAVRLLRALSRRQAVGLMVLLGRLAFRLARKEREKTVRHLTWAYSQEKSAAEIERLAQAVFEHFATAAADSIRMPVVLQQGINTLITSEGDEHLRRALNHGRGAIILTAHLGNWELMGAWIAQNGFPIKVVGRTAYDPRLDRLIVQGRNQAGYTNIARGKGTREIVRALHHNECLGLLIDQDTNVEGVFVNFFNRPAHTATGPVVLARKFGAAIIPSFIHLLPNGRYHVEFQPELELTTTGNEEEDVVTNTQKCSDAIERMVRRYPEQWVWMHERWKKKPA
jgi:Kdo2-lipid IVA lauroyltransferase/acyltransferase